ncbi:MAG TPA: formate/nitrite transporter family protein [Bryobacteraceae bacterium]|jgi:formate/nitrite transporter FocA (FNT family)|nr:formate/nitrite transporter family protein [Bryobacteraceae bacterium]
MTDDDALAGPDLSEKQKEEAEERTSVSVDVVHEAIRKDGDEELNRSISALAWSGLAAGMSMGFSFVAEALLYSHLPASKWRDLVVRLGYPVGFLIVIVGRQQLFTENTLLAIIPLLARRNVSTFIRVVRLWIVVLLANMVGAHIFAWVIGNTPMFRPDIQNAMLAMAKQAVNVTFGAAVLRGIFAGWLIALVVWMLAATDTGRVSIIFLMTYVVGLGDFTHIIAGAVEVLFLPMVGATSWISVAWGYLVPTLLGNIIGGTALTAAINHAQVVAGRKHKGSSEPRILTA